MDNGKRILTQTTAACIVLSAMFALMLVVGVTAKTNSGFRARRDLDAALGIEKADVSVTPTTLHLTEGGSTDAYQIVLTSQPAAPVILSIATDGQTTVSHAVLVFHSANWDSPQTVGVEAVDDSVAEGSHTSTISHKVDSNDATYDTIQPDDVIVTVEDNDSATITADPLRLTVTEASDSAIFTLTLTSEPLLTVTIPVSASNDQCTVSPTLVVLDAANWTQGRSAIVSATDDAIDDGSQTCIIEIGPATGNDPVYRDQDPADVTVTVQDDDVAGIVVAPANLTVSEPNSSAAFTITLTSEPEAPVTIPLNPSNTECTVSRADVIVNKGNWLSDVRLIVTARDDDLVDGDQTCTVQVKPVRSADPNYAGRDPVDVVVTVQDDERIWKAFLPSLVRDWPPLPESPTLLGILNPEGLGSYTLSWSSVPQASTYLLEEAIDSAFADPTQVYAGPASTFLVTDRGAARYYYRVKARNSWGDSPWSNIEFTDVLWEAEPNDLVPAQANGPLPSDLIYYGTFPSEADINDYFYFDLPVPGRVEVSLQGIASGHNYDLILRDSELRTVGYSGQLGSADEHISAPQPEPGATLPAGRYYLQLYNRGQSGSDQPYQLHIAYP